MSPRRKPGEKMKYRGFYCTDELYKEMQDAAASLDESDAEFIRTAVKERIYESKESIKLNSAKKEVRTFFKGDK